MQGDRSILIAIEGIDGAGKTTQAQMLTATLSAAGFDVIASREPTRGPHGNRIRESAASGRLSLEEELQAFIEDRKEHVEQVIRPALESGKTVVLDRYYYSTIAYQGARGADIAAIRNVMEEFAPVPDAVFLVDVPPALGIHRISASRNETPNAFENVENLTSVRNVFAALEDPNIIKIDGCSTAESVHAAIIDALIEGPLKKLCAKSYGCDDTTHCGPRFTRQCEWWNASRRIGAANQQAV